MNEMKSSLHLIHLVIYLIIYLEQQPYESHRRA